MKDNKCLPLNDEYLKYTSTYMQIPVKDNDKKKEHLEKLKQGHKESLSASIYLKEEDLNLNKCSNLIKEDCNSIRNTEDNKRDCRWNYTKRYCEKLDDLDRIKATDYEDNYVNNNKNIYKEEIEKLKKIKKK